MELLKECTIASSVNVILEIASSQVDKRLDLAFEQASGSVS
jgi:hypothetical protein